MEEHERAKLYEAVTRSLGAAKRTLGQSPLRVMVALSGGLDSVVLLELCLELQDALELEVTAAHIDHGLRPTSSDDAAFVESLCRARGVQTVTFRADGLPAGENLEAWARRIRYDFLERARQMHDAHLIATAHHATDQAETLLLRAASGRLASSGFTIHSHDPARRLIRPLLTVDRRVLERFAASRNIAFVHDETNTSIERRRNFVRHQVSPLLEREFGGRCVENLTTVAARLNDDETFLRTLAEEWLERVEHSAAGFAALPPALAWRCLSACAKRELGDQGATIGYRALHSVLALLQSAPGGSRSLDLGRRIVFRLEADGRFCFCQEEEKEEGERWEPLTEEPLQVGVPLHRRYLKSTAVLTARVIEAEHPDAADLRSLTRRGSPLERAVAYFDLEVLEPLELSVRERLPGDKMKVWRRGTRKLKKLFQERGVMLTLRDRIPIVQNRRTVVWVPGIARSDLAPVTERTRVVLELTYERTL